MIQKTIQILEYSFYLPGIRASMHDHDVASEHDSLKTFISIVAKYSTKKPNETVCNYFCH